MNLQPLALAMCKAYARNGGHDFADHFNPEAAAEWMRQALEETGVAELLDAADSAVGLVRISGLNCVRLSMAVSHCSGDLSDALDRVVAQVHMGARA